MAQVYGAVCLPSIAYLVPVSGQLGAFDGARGGAAARHLNPRLQRGTSWFLVSPVV